MTSPLALDPRIATDLAAAAMAQKAPSATAAGGNAKLHKQAQDFEAVFVNQMFQHMFTGIGEDGPFGNSVGVGMWRSFLTDEYAKSFVKGGGMGLSDQVYKQLLTQQEAKPQ